MADLKPPAHTTIEPCELAQLWRGAMLHPGVTVSADGDEAAAAWNALSQVMDKIAAQELGNG